MKISLISILIIFSCVSHAGGSHEEVEVLLYSFFEEDQYILVVKPINGLNANYKDPYMGNCSIFTILGRYEKEGFFERGHKPSKKEFLEAITYLKKRPTKLRLGWMGGGFHILDKQEPCVVESKALQVLEVKDGKAIISWYDGT